MPGLFLCLNTLTQMETPVVFGMLPLTIVFAVYPGLSLIDMNL